MLDDHEARISALEAGPGDYRAVLAAVNALGANQRVHADRRTSVESRLAAVESELADFRQESRARFRSVDEQLAEIHAAPWPHPAAEPCEVLDALGQHPPDAKPAESARPAALRHGSWMADRR